MLDNYNIDRIEEKMKTFACFARGEVGLASIDLFFDNPKQLIFVMLSRDDMWHRNAEMVTKINRYLPETEIIYYEDENEDNIVKRTKRVDAVLLAYWGFIKEPLLSAPKWGYINQHPSFLPFGAGSHAHIWSIIDEEPFGCSIMRINAELDKGDLIFQKKLETDWTDTGKSLYYRGIEEQIKLLFEHKDEILKLNLQTTPQSEGGSFHYKKELAKVSSIDLDKRYTGREMLNLLRAKSFSPFPGCYFTEGGVTYEARIEISVVDREYDSESIDYDQIRIVSRNVE